MHKSQDDAYRVYVAVPEKFMAALQQAITAILTENPAGIHDALQRFYFDAMHFSRVNDLFDEHSRFDVTKVMQNAEKRISRNSRRAQYSA
ncbi:MAG: hypothetical protein ABJA60_09920 [Nitrosospira sp.]